MAQRRDTVSEKFHCRRIAADGCHVMTSKESLALNLIFGSMGDSPFNRTMDDYIDHCRKAAKLAALHADINHALEIWLPAGYAPSEICYFKALRLRWLAPDVATALVNGRQPPQLNAKKLMRLTAHLPADWTEQRALLGFHRESVVSSVNCSVQWLSEFERYGSPFQEMRQKVNHGIAAQRYSRAK